MDYVGVVGMTGEEDSVTVPILGYDMNYAQKEALYRRLTAFAIARAMEKNLLLNMSSGAAAFKRTRGAKATLEYMFVKVEHLPFMRRLGWKCIAFLSKYFYAPMLLRLKL